MSNINLKIEYRDKIVAGQYLTPIQTRDAPLITYTSDPNKLHTIIMYDPDTSNGDYIHFMDINIPNGNITNGQIVLSYKGPSPPPKTGIHRYIFLLFEQEGKLPYKKIENRAFSLDKIKEDFNLKEPIAKAMFTSKYIAGGGKKTRSKRNKKIKKSRKVSFFGA